ncbi:hypothetical protein HYV50_02400 [Candidatus Pacearchaeota archaeon]|nr:hypothetical protein [Candidatus Pacearchaeota archaeon]
MFSKEILKKGKWRLSFFVLLIITILSFSVFALVSVLGLVGDDVNVAAHDPLITISPEEAGCGNFPQEFTVKVNNGENSTDDIMEVRIYGNVGGIDDFECGDAPEDWNLAVDFTAGFGYCEYKAETDSAKIAAGESLDFTFSARIVEPNSDDQCNQLFSISTLDDGIPVGEHEFTDPLPEIEVDCLKPETTKIFEGPFFKNEDGVEWIDGHTTITLDAEDQQSQCRVSGLDKTWYANILSESEDPCWKETEEACKPILKSPYKDEETVECINDKQELCGEEFEQGSDAWFDCVESHFEKCEVDSNWKLYRGEPIEKDEESCHVLQWFSVDNLGNVENTGVNCFFVDVTKPVAVARTGEPKIECSEEDPSGCDWWITNNTEIKLTCQKGPGEPHPAPFDTISWRITLDNGEPSEWFMADAEEGVTITFQEDSIHKLEYTCNDTVGKEDEVKEKIFRVDMTPPIISKTLEGLQSGDCPPGSEGDECFITPETIIHVNVEDPDPSEMQCNIKGVSCRWGYWFEDEFFGWYDETDSEFDINFREDSTHQLIIQCEDELGNMIEDNETFLVDSTPPETTKTYGEQNIPTVFLLYGEISVNAHYINSNTSITLTAKDNKSGVDETFYSIEILCDFSFESEEDCDQIEWVGTYDRNIYHDEKECLEFNTLGTCIPTAWSFKRELGFNPQNPFAIYTNPFVIPQESVHKICFFSVDKIGNKEEIHCQVAIVDNTAPQFNKEVGTPQVKCDESEDCDYFITQQTPIYLSCSEDPEPHPVNNVELFWRDYLEGTEAPEFTPEESGKVTIYKEQDSRHILEAYCADALDNRDTDKEIFVVDSVAPEITKEILGPSYGNCPPESENDTCYVDTATTIVVNAIDPQPHPVNDVKCSYEYKVIVPEEECEGDFSCDARPSGGSSDNLTPPFNITFPEESIHHVRITCEDALGNTARDEETFIVDRTPPTIEKILGEPSFEEEGVEWISSQTEIHINAFDPQPHPSGLKEVSYRTTIVDDEACRSREVCQENTEGRGDFTVLGEDRTFTIPQSSCHLIEIMATDNVDKTSTHKQCVFVDNTAPITNKTVREPNDPWTPGENGDPESTFYPEANERCWNNEENELECWEVTTLTPITLDCQDQEPHPVNHEVACFNVDLDGEDVTGNYCEKVGGSFNESGDGFCCMLREQTPKDIFFNEESEHNLKFYCEDALGNKGPIDEEKFKVEGTAFSIWLNKKWNLISVPFVLLNSDPEKVFENVDENISAVWTYDGATGDWFVWRPGQEETSNLEEIVPGVGYWLEATDMSMLTIGGSLFSPQVTPPMRELASGWNLIGYYGNENSEGEPINEYHCPTAEGKEAICSLNSLVDTTIGHPRWSSLFTYCQATHPSPWIPLDNSNRMTPGAGYWLEMDVKDNYVPATSCFGGI